MIISFETNDLIYEGIATAAISSFFVRYVAETNDLIYEGIATSDNAHCNFFVDLKQTT